MRTVIVLMFFAIFGFLANAADNFDVDTREDIRIKELYQSEGEVDRDNFIHLKATFLKELRVVEIEYSGIENPTIYLVDNSGQIVEQLTPLSSSSIEYLSVPSNSGIFTLVVWSEKYYGEGVFTIS